MNDLNIIIHCAAIVNFHTHLDEALKINVTAPLLLLKLAE